MGTVYLTKGHHGLFIRNPKADLSTRVVLTKELLARPILNVDLTQVQDHYQGMIRAALRALQKLPFDAAVSYSLKKKDGVEHVAFPHREWGEIYHGTKVIVGFSHDTRQYNAPFRRIWQWTEDSILDKDSTDVEFEDFCLAWSSSERWLDYFKKRIWEKIQSLRDEAYKLESEATEHKSLAAALRMSLT